MESNHRVHLGVQENRREIICEGVKLAYRDEGTGQALVCLHAIGHGARDFEGLYQRCKGMRVIALDWPGHGHSGGSQEAPTIENYTKLLREFVQQLGLERPVFLGNSIGGSVAICYASQYPEEVAGLVLCNPGGLYQRGWLARLAVRWMVSFFAQGRKKKSWYAKAFAMYYKLVLPRPEAAEQRERIIASAYEIAPLLEAAWRGFGELASDLRGLVQQVRCPVFFAWARQDRILALRNSLSAIKQFPRYELETFSGGHSAFLEAPDAFYPRLQSFLQSHIP